MAKKIYFLMITLAASSTPSFAMLQKLKPFAKITKALYIKKQPTYNLSRSLNSQKSFYKHEAFDFIKNDELQKLKNLFEKEFIDVKATNKYGQTLLNFACEETNNPNIINFLLKKGLIQSINHEDKDGTTPACSALKNEYLTVFKLLLNHGVLVNKANAHKETPLYWAVRENWPEAVELLLKNGAQINEFENPFIQACYNGNIEIIKIMLKHFPKNTFNKMSYDNSFGQYFYDDKSAGKNPIWIACAMGHKEVLEILLENGFEINKESTEELLYVNCNKMFCKDIIRGRRNKSFIETIIKKNIIQ